MTAQPLPRDTPGESPAGFRFIQELAAELSLGTVELPGFPAVAMNVQRALADREVTTERLLRIVSVEPVLAGRIMQIANSAALARSGGPVVELRTAITRLGFDLLRGTVIAHALAQVRRAPELRSLARPLHALWQQSVRVAVLCHAIARRCPSINRDTAMLAGLLNSVGRLYILVRASRHPQLFADRDGYQSIERDWHAAIAKALLENWGVPDDIAQAVGDCEDPEREHRGTADLADVLAAGCVLAAHRGKAAQLEAELSSAKACVRLALTPEDCEAVFRETDGDLLALRSAFGG